ncbi:hypothetical protein I6F15_29065 [Bradyrhizobium sp. BRP14]|nr:hypothetical protein [Bradyrhizobium sp. BRP14]
MRASLRKSFAAFVLSSALAGAAAPALADGYYYEDGVPTDSVDVDPIPDVVYVDPVPTGSIYYEQMPASTLGGARERYTHEYQGGGQGDYYLGITPPAPVP